MRGEYEELCLHFKDVSIDVKLFGLNIGLEFGRSFELDKK